SLIGVAANLLVVPLAGPTTTLGMLALLTQVASETAASLLFNTLWLLLIALRVAVWAAAAIPGAMVHLPAPSWAPVTAWCGALLLVPYLATRAWTRVAASGLLAVAMALSHSDSDHAGGLGAVLRHFHVGEFWESGRWGPGGEDALLALPQSGAARRVLGAGQRLWLGNALVTVLNPDGQPSVSPNDDSLVLRLDWRGVSVLLTGDLGWRGEARVLERGEPVRVLMLRVGHHGSRFSSTTRFLESARPPFAIIS